MIYTNFREIDNAGRIEISKDNRNPLTIRPGDSVPIEADDECVTIKKAESKCVFCNTLDNLIAFGGKYVCRDCVEKLKG